MSTNNNNINSLSSKISNLGQVSFSFDKIYPIGSIYMSVNNTDPSTLFGGTWQQLKDRFLLGAGSYYRAGNTGGEETHTLTTSEMPSHTHEIAVNYNPSAYEFGESYSSGNIIKGSPIVTGSAGGDSPHNNMPPYLVVYMWKRTA